MFLLSYRLGYRKSWEADFVRHLLGFTSCLEENVFNKTCEEQKCLCSVPASVTQKIGKAFTAQLRHDGALAGVLEELCL